MNATTTKRPSIARLNAELDGAAPTDYIHAAHNAILTELPGLAFGLVTLLYLFTAVLPLH
jgi:hypothetical protein